jgi:hypothetical protein
MTKSITMVSLTVNEFSQPVKWLLPQVPGLTWTYRFRNPADGSLGNHQKLWNFVFDSTVLPAIDRLWQTFRRLIHIFWTRAHLEPGIGSSLFSQRDPIRPIDVGHVSEH